MKKYGTVNGFVEKLQSTSTPPFKDSRSLHIYRSLYDQSSAFEKLPRFLKTKPFFLVFFILSLPK